MNNKIYQTTIQAVQCGARFQVDFKTRSLKLNGKYIIRNGEFTGNLGIELNDEKQVLSEIETLFRRYKHSIPSERSESKKRKYFKALAETELDDEDMMFGTDRESAQAELELYVLCQILNGFKWNQNTMGSWFWQSPSDKDLVLLRSWVEPEQ